MRISDAKSSSAPQKSAAISDTIQYDPDAFHILDLNIADNPFFSFEYNRKIFYTATLLQGEYRLEFEDRNIDISGNSLLFTTTKIPFGIHATGSGYAGISCVFKEEFITKANSGYRLLEFPIYKPGRQNIYSLTDEQTKHFIAIYTKVFNETQANSAFKDNLQRIYLLEIIFNAQKLAPVSSFIKTNNTTEVIACSFIRLLESQFPLFLTHQYIDQIHEKIRSAIFGNVGTIISFRIGAQDAEYLAKEFHPVFNEDDLINLPRYSMYLKLMIDGETSQPFSAATLPPQTVTNSLKEKVIEHSRQKYGKERAVVEKNIFEKHQQPAEEYGAKGLFD